MNIDKIIFASSAFFLIVILETVAPLFRNRKNRLQHGFRNIFIFVLNNLIIYLLMAVLLGGLYQSLDRFHWGLFAWIPLSVHLRTLLILLLFDLWMYIWHRLNHEVPFLWRFHRMHHTDPQMDVTTALRFHTVEIIFSAFLRVAVMIVLGMTIHDLILYESMMMPVIFLHHSNFYLPAGVDKVLRQLVVTPWMHWVHHSNIPEETNSNYGTIFSWWDRLAGTFRMRHDPRKIIYGVREFSDPQWQSITGMLRTPFVSPHKTVP